MPAKVREYLVFIASPSGCDEERAEVRAAVEQVNASFREQSVSFRVSGWETTTPALGRAQSLINPMVDDCDIFVGILANLWGSPSGEESSGFLEEFRRAQLRRTSGDDYPHISLHFRTPPAEMLRDPGTELSRVLSFQEDIRTNYTALYSQHASVHEFGKKILASLTEFAVRAFVAETSAASSSRPTDHPPTPTESTDESVDDARAQLIATTQQASDVFAGRADGWFDRDRLLLVAKAFAVDDEYIPEHLANRLYSKTDTIVLSQGEARTILRSLLADIGSDNSFTNRVIPGWAHFRGPDSRPFGAGSLNELARFTQDAASAVARAALFVLQTEEARPSYLWPRAGTKKPPPRFITRWQTALDQAGTDALVRYIVSVVAPHDYDFLAGLAASPALTKQAEALNAVADYARGDAVQLSHYGLRSAVLYREAYVPHIEDALATLDSDDLTKTLTTSWVPTIVRGQALELLAERGDIGEELVRKLLSGDNGLWDKFFPLMFSYPALADLIVAAMTGPTDKQPPISAKHRLQAELVGDATFDDLDFDDLDYPAKWDGVARKHPDAAIETARAVLRDGASDYITHLSQSSLGQTHPDLVGYLGAQVRAAALAALARRPDPSDAALFAAHVDDSDYAHVVRQEAVNGLLKTATFETDGEIQALAGLKRYWIDTDLILRQVAHAVVPYLRAISKIDHAEIRGAAVERLVLSNALSTDDAMNYLYDDDNHVRASAARGLAATLPTDELQEVLTRYRSERTWHWYNVVVILDQAIYGPPGMRRLLRRQT